MPVRIPSPALPTSISQPQPTTGSGLQAAIDNINQKVEYYDDLDEKKQNYLAKVKSGEDKEEAKKCFDLLKNLLKNIDSVKSKEEYTKALDATENFDSFCTIFPKELFDRYFAPKFHSIYDTLDKKFEQLSTSTSTPTTSGAPTSGANVDSYTGPSIIDYLDKKGQSSDFESRRSLAVQQGIVSKPEDYKGTPEQNTALLNKLRGTPSASPSKTNQPPVGPVPPIGVSGKAASRGNDSKELIGTDSQGNSLYFVRIGAGNYRPAVVADKRAGVQLFARNPNPAARLVYPFIKIQNMPTRRANT